MAKVIVALFCFILAVHGSAGSSFSDWLNPTEQLEQELTSKIQDIVNNSRELLERPKYEAMYQLSELKKLAARTHEEAVIQIRSIMDPVQVRIKALKEKAHYVHADYCLQIAEKLSETVDAVVENVDNCLSEKINKAIDVVNEITQTSGNIVVSVQNISHMTMKCVKSQNGFSATIVCLQNVLTQAIRLSTEDIEDFVMESMSMISSIVKLQDSLIDCSVAQLLPRLLRTSIEIIEKIQSCIVEKITHQGTPRKCITTSTTEPVSTTRENFVGTTTVSSGPKEPFTTSSATEEPFASPRSTEESSIAHSATEKSFRTPSATEEPSRIPRATEEASRTHSVSEEPSTSVTHSISTSATDSSTPEEPFTTSSATEEAFRTPSATEEPSRAPSATEEASRTHSVSEEPSTSVTHSISTSATDSSTPEEPFRSPSATEEPSRTHSATEEASSIPSATEELSPSPSITDEAFTSVTYSISTSAIELSTNSIIEYVTEGTSTVPVTSITEESDSADTEYPFSRTTSSSATSETNQPSTEITDTSEETSDYTSQESGIINAEESKTNSAEQPISSTTEQVANSQQSSTTVTVLPVTSTMRQPSSGITDVSSEQETKGTSKQPRITSNEIPTIASSTDQQASKMTESSTINPYTGCPSLLPIDTTVASSNQPSVRNTTEVPTTTTTKKSLYHRIIDKPRDFFKKIYNAL